MTTQDLVAAKVRLLPQQLVEEVNDFIDFLLQRNKAREQAEDLTEAGQLAESDLGDYAANLSEYEELLARGEIQW